MGATPSPRRRGIVVQVNNLHRLTAEHSQTEEAGLPFVKVKHIREHTRLRVTRLDGDEHRLGELPQVRRGSPKLQFRGHHHLVAEFEKRAVSVGDFQQANLSPSVGPCRGRRDAFAANPHSR
jgi:hypothetical protein